MQQRPEDLRLCLASAHVLGEAGWVLQAETAYRMALQIEPESLELLLHLAMLLCSGGRLGEAETCLRKARSEEHTSELQSPCNLVCRLLLEKKKIQQSQTTSTTLIRPPSCINQSAGCSAARYYQARITIFCNRPTRNSYNIYEANRP